MRKPIFILSLLIIMLIITGCPNGLVDPAEDDGTTGVGARDDVNVLFTTYSDGIAVIFYEEPDDTDFSYTALIYTPEASGVTQPVTVKAGEGVTALTTSMIATGGLTNDTEYTFTIKAVYSDGAESEGLQRKITPRSGVAAPENLNAVPGDGKITLNWDIPADNNWITVTAEFTPEDPDFAQPVGFANDATSVEITGLDNGTEYTFSVSASDLFNNYSTAATVSATPSEALALPVDNSASVFLIDTDMDAGDLAGVCSIEKALDESSIETYNLYWGSSDTVKLGTQITSISKTGTDLEYTFAENTAPPSGATHILIYSANANGEVSIPFAYELDDFIVTTEPYMGQPSIPVDVGTDLYTSFQLLPDNYLYEWTGSTFSALSGVTVDWTTAPGSLSSFGQELMFCADDGVEPSVLWEYDTVAGTAVRVAGITGYCYSGIEYDSKYYFSMQDPAVGKSLYSYDGTSINLVYDCDSDSTSQSTLVVGIYDGMLIFMARNAENDEELYLYDGTALEQITSFAGAAVINPYSYLDKDSRLYFAAGPDNSHYEIYSWDGTLLVQETTLNADGFSFSDSMFEGFSIISEYNSEIYFTAGNATIGFELWKFNGTEEQIVHNFYPDGEGLLTYGGFPMGTMVFDDYLFMQAYHEGDGNMLHLYDGVHDPVQLIDVESNDNSSELTYTVPYFQMNGDLIFVNSSDFTYYRFHIASF